MKLRSTALAALALALVAGCTNLTPTLPQRQLMLVANDEKQSWNDAGAVILGPMGRDTVQVLDIGTDPLAPKVLGTLHVTCKTDPKTGLVDEVYHLDAVSVEPAS